MRSVDGEGVASLAINVVRTEEIWSEEFQLKRS